MVCHEAEVEYICSLLEYILPLQEEDGACSSLHLLPHEEGAFLHYVDIIIKTSLMITVNFLFWKVVETALLGH